MKLANSYQACFDVKYYVDFAIIGYVLFEDIHSTTAFKTGQFRHEKIEPYISGEFYKRELPCLLTAINQINDKISLIYIDGNVWLGDNLKGLGYYLYESLGSQVPVIGISKTSFHNSDRYVIPVVRPNSIKPIFVSAIGIETEEATKMVLEMTGEYRLPTMIKLADTMSKIHFC